MATFSISRMAKHVIILGAGASVTSGYPMANGLRLLLGSADYFRQKAREDHEEFKKNNPLLKNPREYDPGHADFCFTYHAAAVQKFRSGGFGTVDEFCKLIALQNDPNLSRLANGMRQLTRLALGLRNPEYGYQDSDYYPFVQRLFDKDLISLRDDLTILTFNYDPYLEFLLLRALRERAGLVGKPPPSNEIIDSVTSGLFSRNIQWMQSARPTFKLLKLHGGICMNESEHHAFFTAETNDRIKKLAEDEHTPPVLFPWEVIGEDGRFHDSAKFSLHGYGPLFQAIWQTARDEVQYASKISFVGFSMHSFLFNTLEFLFKIRERTEPRGKTVKVVVADIDHETIDERRNMKLNEHPPHSPIVKLSGFFQNLNNRIQSEAPSLVPYMKGYSLSSRRSFRDFINKEMDPLPDQ
jgi:hypothetical protein